jgi:DNA-binding response OmpR family regulator
MKSIYIVEDEERLLNITISFLKKEGYEVKGFSNGEAFISHFLNIPCEMVLIDLMLPGIGGFEIIEKIREISDIPIIVLSAKGNENDKIKGLKLGCDDYLVKPFSMLELIARINRTFQRIDREKIIIEPDYFEFGLFNFNNRKKILTYNEEIIPLSLMEFNVLTLLVLRKGTAVTREELLKRIWGINAKIETRATDDMIKRIRKKISKYSNINITSIRGIGYLVEDINED